MRLNDYQESIVRFDVSGERRAIDEVDFAFLDKVLGITGEAGEVADKVKKIVRDRYGMITEEDKQALERELGDVLWYVATVARYLGISLESVAKTNIEKLDNRWSRGTISGSGDER